MYLDYAEDQAERNIPMTMEDWAGKLNAFLQFNDGRSSITPVKSPRKSPGSLQKVNLQNTALCRIGCLNRILIDRSSVCWKRIDGRKRDQILKLLVVTSK